MSEVDLFTPTDLSGSFRGIVDPGVEALGISGVDLGLGRFRVCLLFLLDRSVHQVTTAALQQEGLDLGVIDAGSVSNEIESEVAGEVRAIRAENGSRVEINAPFCLRSGAGDSTGLVMLKREARDDRPRLARRDPSGNRPWS